MGKRPRYTSELVERSASFHRMAHELKADVAHAISVAESMSAAAFEAPSLDTSASTESASLFGNSSDEVEPSGAPPTPVGPARGALTPLFASLVCLPACLDYCHPPGALAHTPHAR